MKTYKTQLGSQEVDLVIKAVENEEEKLKAFVVRAIVYMHEQDCPFPEEFDLNDYCSTQIIGLIEGEPVLTARIRYFGTFAKLERLAIRKKYRGRGYGHYLLQYMLEFCQQKGFSEFYLHAQKRLEGFYREYGFVPIGEEFAFSDHEYIEMAASLKTGVPSIASGLDAMILNRPEGKWDRSGPLEQSVNPVTVERVECV